MAKYRQIYTDFWSDGFVLDLTPEEKYFYKIEEASIYMEKNDEKHSVDIEENKHLTKGSEDVYESNNRGYDFEELEKVV